MNKTTAIERMNAWSRKGRYVFLVQDLAKIFHEDSPKTFKEGLQRLARAGVFVRACRGVYLYAYAQSRDSFVLEHIAKALRRGFYNYISLESALSEAGAISQIPLDRLTVMTTGRKGEYRTPYGVIEFTHTKRPEMEILDDVYSAGRPLAGRPLKVATLKTALRDLKRVGRNTHLLDWEVLNEQS